MPQASSDTYETYYTLYIGTEPFPRGSYGKYNVTYKPAYSPSTNNQNCVWYMHSDHQGEFLCHTTAYNLTQFEARKY